MFDILSNFADFPKVSIEVYTETSVYDPNTGQIVTGYSLNDTLKAWGLQKSAAQTFIRDTVFDTVDLVFILDTLPDHTAYIKYNELWYSIAYPDNIAFADTVYTIGCTRTTAPNLL